MKQKDMTINNPIFHMFTVAAHSVIETIDEIIHKGVTVKEIADMIKNHEYTRKISKTLLGVTFEFYSLKINNLSFHLEVRKGIIDHVLYLNIHTAEHVVLTYRSYEEGLKLDDQIKKEHLPEIVNDNKKRK
ncbi:hypothetical protein BKP45_15740 [Anaerobacillus alkalidiazotrophicus]|uniref:Uncharacterized protein n=1 Tax=Anaerobacillus alkalidiazotrophicus TaxID=472963 RepID=A0A1S2M520_9BACI|nr:hypothetical protein [Anaerobacillus alkalidiazotrophicus]OIJ18735.1 hypothetical protein BKP45_15740 [Anaerobacillus alkalidiazotrophicus]